MVTSDVRYFTQKMGVISDARNHKELGQGRNEESQKKGQKNKKWEIKWWASHRSANYWCLMCRCAWRTSVNSFSFASFVHMFFKFNSLIYLSCFLFDFWWITICVRDFWPIETHYSSHFQDYMSYLWFLWRLTYQYSHDWSWWWLKLTKQNERLKNVSWS